MARLIKVGEYRNDSERWAAEFLEERLPDDYSIFVSVDVFDDFGFRLDCDQIIIGEYAVYVIEVKAYSGEIVAEKDDWQLAGGRIVCSPVSSTTRKAKTLASRLRERVSGRRIHTPWCQPAVFVTGGRGGQVTLRLEEEREAVFDRNEIIDALMSPDRLNTRFRNPLSSDQKALAQGVITNLRLLRQRPTKVGSFENIRELGTTGRIKVCTGSLKIGELERKFLLRIADAYSYDHPDLWRADYQSLTDEARLYHELESVPGIPYAAPLIEEDESVTFAIAYPAGKPLSALAAESFDADFRRDVLESVAETLKLIHQRGMAHGGLEPDWIYVTDGGTVEILNLSAESSVESQWSAPEVSEAGIPDEAGDVFTLAHIFVPWFGSVGEDGEFEPDEGLDASHESIFEWLGAALDRGPSSRPPVADLVRSLRRMELGIVPVSEADDEPFERKPGAVLHGTYQLEDSLGTSPAGEVWQASHVRGNYPLALYFVDLETVGKDWVSSRFEEIARLHHPMMVRMLDMRWVPGRDALYIAADWLDGSPLDVLLEEGEKVAQEQAILWLRDLLVVLEYIHGEEVLHRNITPDAVVIAQGRPRLVEFSLKPEKDNAAGLVEYADPMIAERGWCRESDLYALAATFLPILAGITPRTGWGRTVDLERVRSELQESLPDAVRDGILAVLSPEFELADKNYLGLFGLETIQRQSDQLPTKFLEDRGIRNLEQQYIAWHLLREFHGKSGVRARNRMRVAEGTRKLMGHLKSTLGEKEKVRRNINPLIRQGFLESKKRGGPVRPTDFMLDQWRHYLKEKE